MKPRNLRHRAELWKKSPKEVSYDAFFAGKSPVTTVQFWGLVVLGISLIAGAVILVINVALLFDNAQSRSDAKIAVFLTGCISACIGYFGFLHIKRALMGKR